MARIICDVLRRRCARITLDAADARATRYLGAARKEHAPRIASRRRRRASGWLRWCATTELNDAYSVLKKPMSSAPSICSSCAGIDIGDEKPQSTTGATKQLVGSAFLMEILELREELAEARGDGDSGKVAMLTQERASGAPRRR